MGTETPLEALRLSAREPDAFVGFYDHHAKRLLAYFARRVCDPDIALELTAETFAQAYVARVRFRGNSEGEAAGWLYKIAQRQLGRYLRKAHVERKALECLGVEPPGLDDQQRERVEELAGLVGVRSELRVELSRLTAAHREALQLRVVEELPYPEVAGRLGVSEQTARMRVSRGLRALAAALDRNSRVEEKPA